MGLVLGGPALESGQLGGSLSGEEKGALPRSEVDGATPIGCRSKSSQVLGGIESGERRPEPE